MTFNDIINNDNYVTVNDLLGAIKEYDPDVTYPHCIRTGNSAALLAEKLGFSKEKIEEIRIAGYLHDVGKINIPFEIINSKNSLTFEERKIMQNHPKYGVQLLQKLNPEELKQSYIQAASDHHFGMDQKGYRGLEENSELSEIAQIMMIADVYDAISHPRSYDLDKDGKTLDLINTILYEDIKSNKYNMVYAKFFCEQVIPELRQEQNINYEQINMVYQEKELLSNINNQIIESKYNLSNIENFCFDKNDIEKQKENISQKLINLNKEWKNITGQPYPMTSERTFFSECPQIFDIESLKIDQNPRYYEKTNRETKETTKETYKTTKDIDTLIKEAIPVHYESNSIPDKMKEYMLL